MFLLPVGARKKKQKFLKTTAGGGKNRGPEAGRQAGGRRHTKATMFKCRHWQKLCVCNTHTHTRLQTPNCKRKKKLQTTLKSLHKQNEGEIKNMRARQLHFSPACSAASWKNNALKPQTPKRKSIKMRINKLKVMALWKNTPMHAFINI